MVDASEQLDRLQTALFASGDVVYDWDLIDDSVTWVGRTDALFGGAINVATGDAFSERVYTEDIAARAKAMAAHFSTRDIFDCDYRVRGIGGKLTWVHDRGTAYFIEGRPVRMTGTLRIITARKQRESELEYLANYDQLTGHFNRPRLKAALEHALASSSRYAAPGAFLVIGIDKLGPINDAYSSATADAIILGVGQRLDRCLRAADIIGRLGGDCFGIVLSRCPPENIALAAEKILAAVREQPFDTPSGPIHVTVSIGGIPFGSSASLTAHDAMNRADDALQQAKQAGRNCYAPFIDSGEHREEKRRSVVIVEEVQTALKADRLVFAYQPIVSAATREVDHYECLLRLRREDGSLLAAGAFMPFVEQTGLMRLIDRHSLELAVRELVEYPEVKLAINISGLTASDRSWLRALTAMVKNRPDVARRLTIEITETVALQDIDETARFVGAIRELGCSVALDDFGAGYTSFRNLKALAVDCVKIDGSYVRGLADNVDNQLFIRTLLGLAEGFGLATVAECVETAADAAHLTRRGVRFLQGYLFGRPAVDRPWLERPNTPRLAVVQGGAAAPRPFPLA
jgi:diguanylate cyclase (GGDEF)-like protein